MVWSRSRRRSLCLPGFLTSLKRQHREKKEEGRRDVINASSGRCHCVVDHLPHLFHPSLICSPSKIDQRNVMLCFLAKLTVTNLIADKFLWSWRHLSAKPNNCIRAHLPSVMFVRPRVPLSVVSRKRHSGGTRGLTNKHWRESAHKIRIFRQ